MKMPHLRAKPKRKDKIAESKNTQQTNNTDINCVQETAFFWWKRFPWNIVTHT